MRRPAPQLWIILLSAALALAVSATAYAAPGPASPIPEGPDGSTAAAYLGAPVRARPIHHGSFAPQHPFMAANGRSNLHNDAYQSDAGPQRGPLGRDPQVRSNFFSEECASHTFDRAGRLLTVCVGLAEVTLRMLDPRTLDVLAEYSLPPRQPSSTPFSSFGGGGYFYLDQRDRVVVPTSQGTIEVIREAGTQAAPTFELARSYDVSSAVGSSLILSALPDWHGRIWFVTGAGVVGMVARHSGRVRAADLHEKIGNSFAVDETGGVVVVSDAALYRFHARHGRPVVTWRQTYDHGDRQKPGQTQVGSGTTPTLVVRGGRRYVAITDNADPRMHVLVYRIGHRRPICRMPVFGKNTSDTDNSLISFGRSFVVENNYGYTGPQEQPPASTPERQTPTTQPGVTRVVVDYRHGGCRKAWTAQVRVPTSVSKASTRTGLVYVYEHPAADEISYPGGEPLSGAQDPWYLTALDARTGVRRWSVRTGSGLGYNNNYAPITLGPDGTAYVGVLGGILSVRDTR
jgi:outer membrane protein assembly factor BamB